MITLEQCKIILEKNEYKLADNEIKQVREYLYLLASFQCEMENNGIQYGIE